jgi:ferredoxin
MATMITEECINCGACEPECPNTAIYQGGVEWELDGVKHPPLAADVFYIVPEKCTECVGFFDHEACAAVCPVDVCIPNPDIPETEDQLIARAKQLHPGTDFGGDFPSRFREGGGAGAAAPAASPAAAPATAAPAAAAAPVAPAGPTLNLPAIETWEIPLDCHACGGSYAVLFQHLRSGNVLRCPYCKSQYIVTTSLHNQISKVLREFHGRWAAAFEELREQRQRELDEFETRQKAELEQINEKVRSLSKSVLAPGAPKKRAWIFG